MYVHVCVACAYEYMHEYGLLECARTTLCLAPLIVSPLPPPHTMALHSVTEMCQVYEEGAFRFDRAWLYLAMINTISQGVSKNKHLDVCVCVCVCACMRVHVCVHTYVHACVCVLCRTLLYPSLPPSLLSSPLP